MPIVDPLLAETDTLSARVAALEDALRPFADSHVKLGGKIHGMSLQGWGDAYVKFTGTQFERAAEVLYGTTPTKEV